MSLNKKQRRLFEAVGRSLLSAILMVGFLGTLSCTELDGSKDMRASAPTGTPTPPNRNEKMTTAQLNKLYVSAPSEYERRSVCLQAIDSRAFFRTGPVSSVDEIFGTTFAKNLPTKGEARRTGVIDFDMQSPPAANEMAEATAHKGWYLVVEYDYNGEIQNYYLSNLHK